MVKCENCGRELDEKAKLDDDKHIFHRRTPTMSSWMVCCRDCFRKTNKQLMGY